MRATPPLRGRQFRLRAVVQPERAHRTKAAKKCAAIVVVEHPR